MSGTGLSADRGQDEWPSPEFGCLVQAYDSLNRLLSRTPDPTLGEPTVSFTYTATGKRQTMTDGCGTTTYGYDSADRLT